MMNLTTRTISRLSCLIAGAFAAISCLRDDLSDCPPVQTQLRIAFDRVRDEYATDVNQLDVFIFNGDGVLEEHIVRDDIVLVPDYTIETRVLPGVHTFVAWTNLDKGFSLTPSVARKGETRLSELLVSLTSTKAKQHSGELPMLVWAATTETIPVPDVPTPFAPQEPREVRLPLYLDNYLVNVTVYGLEEGHRYHMSIEDDNYIYASDNGIVPGEGISYVSGLLTPDSGVIHSGLEVLKLETGRSPVLKITDQTAGTALLGNGGVALMPLLAEASARAGGALDLENQHVFDVYIYYNKATFSATITIGGWSVNVGAETVLGQ